jgi:Holliday junction DNA helicase RuvA
MIGYLQGTILKKIGKSIILNTGNVGYSVNLPAPLLEKCKEGKTLELYIYTKVREDDISLFGFAKIEELEFFKTVLNVNGVGPKTALEILSQDIDKTKAAILSNNILFLSKIPGIGKKTAEKMILELKDKISKNSDIHQDKNTQEELDVLEALKSLGYSQNEAREALKQVEENLDTSKKIKSALKILSAR